MIACTRFEEKSGKLPDFFRKIIVARGLPCLADPATRRERTLLAVPPRRKRHFRNWRRTRRRRLPKPLMVCSKSVPWGHVAEWLRNGLQNRVHQFNSGRGLHIKPIDFAKIFEFSVCSGKSVLLPFCYRMAFSLPVASRRKIGECSIDPLCADTERSYFGFGSAGLDVDWLSTIRPDNWTA